MISDLTPRCALFGSVVVASVVLAAAPSYADWPTSGGESGETIHVTTLANEGPGSLRAALAVKKPRIIVFDVAGEIFLNDRLSILHPFVTVAGETAPSPGITLMGDKVQIRANDVIFRHIRVRVGERPGSGPSSRDGISIDLGPKGEHVARILIDHCSVAWAIDENVGIWGDGVRDVFMRRTIVAEALRNSIHPEIRHSMGMLVGKQAKNIVVGENLFAHNVHRNPLIDAGVSAVVFNNLIYGPEMEGFHVYGKKEAGPTLVSVVGNLLIAGPKTRPWLRSFDHGINKGSKVFYDDNKVVGTKAFLTTELAGKKPTDPVPFVDAPPFWFDWIRPVPPDQLEADILDDVGARPWDRDATDKRIIAEVRDRTGSIKDTPPDKRLQVPRPLSRPESKPGE